MTDLRREYEAEKNEPVDYEMQTGFRPEYVEWLERKYEALRTTVKDGALVEAESRKAAALPSEGLACAANSERKNMDIETRQWDDLTPEEKAASVDPAPHIKPRHSIPEPEVSQAEERPPKKMAPSEKETGGAERKKKCS
jgi:hypothetical protein